MTAVLLALRACWPYLACLVLGAAGAWQLVSAHFEARIAAIELDAATAQTAAVDEAYRLTNKWQGAKDNAIKQAESRAAVAQRNTVIARVAVDGLQRDFADVPGRIANATRAAVDQYAATSSRLLNDCSRRYIELAKTAQGHADDVRTVLESWPR